VQLWAIHQAKLHQFKILGWCSSQLVFSDLAAGISKIRINKIHYLNPQSKEISWRALLMATFFDSAFKFTW